MNDHYRTAYLKVLRGDYPQHRLTALANKEPGALQGLFAEADDPNLDGERAEGYAYDLVFALIVVGDEHYAKGLAAQPISRRRRLASQIMFGFGALHGKVPKTEAICRNFYPKKEQGHP